jgi:16S rRNA (adenine1518-N6/adenine1519-N6)-dimethyltransferase
MVQKEVSRRIVAKPPKMNLLALSVQLYSRPEIIADVSKGSFSPMPGVDSAIIKLTPNENYPDVAKVKELFNFIRAGFSEKRKQLLPTFSKKLNLDKGKVETSLNEAGIDIKTRPENLSLKDWISLKDSLTK